MKKIFQITLILLLVLFSFYYTNKAVIILANNDPIMKQIKEKSKDLEISATDAKITNNKITPGYNGKTVDLEESFYKMKNYGKYNESLLVFEEVTPSISVEDYYDKYISSGNGFTTNIALIFTINKDTYTDNVLNILKDNNVVGTFFVDGVFLEKNLDFINSAINNLNEVEILSYDNNYEKILFESSVDRLQSISGISPKYCYASYDQEEILNLCSSLNMHTIIPTLNLKNNLYQNAKGNLRSGSIININLTKENINELSVLIKYIKQRGFNMVNLDTLLNEARYEK